MSRWILKKDGWHKNEKSKEKGDAGFLKNPPPAQWVDGEGQPIRNWKQEIAKSNKENGTPNPYDNQ